MKSVAIKIVSVIESGVFGVLLIDSVPIAVTLWRTYSPDENESEFTKLNVGVYQCERTMYHKGGYETFEIKVPGHSRILFHIGNKETDSDGCVLIGEEFGKMNELPAILRSGVGFKEFMNNLVGVNKFPLTIT
jgi:hypothetical protein